VAVALDAAGERLIMACEDGGLEDVASFSGARTSARMVFGQSRPEASAIALLSDGTHIVVATRDGTVALVAIATGAIVREATVAGRVTSVVAAPYGDVWVRPDVWRPPATGTFAPCSNRMR